MTEGLAAHTATLTVELSRRLYEGEVIVVPLTLATSTGARLPGSVDGSTVANHDFTVAASGTRSGQSGVTIANAGDGQRRRLTFTGDNTDTVQTATVTLAPVAGRERRGQHPTRPSPRRWRRTACSAPPARARRWAAALMAACVELYAASLTLEDDEPAHAGDDVTLSRTASSVKPDCACWRPATDELYVCVLDADHRSGGCDHRALQQAFGGQSYRRICRPQMRWLNHQTLPSRPSNYQTRPQHGHIERRWTRRPAGTATARCLLNNVTSNGGGLARYHSLSKALSGSTWTTRPSSRRFGYIKVWQYGRPADPGRPA